MNELGPGVHLHLEQVGAEGRHREYGRGQEHEAWTPPRTWVVGEVVTAAMLNTHVRDNSAHLRAQSIVQAYGQLGAPVVDGAFHAFADIASMGFVDMDAIANTQWRVSCGFNLTAINGCTDLSVHGGRRRVVDSAGNAGGDTQLAADFMPVTTGWKMLTGAWFSESFSGWWIVRPIYKFQAVGGVPTIVELWMALEARGN